MIAPAWPAYLALPLAVTPEHVVPQILAALPFAVERGLRLPIVYNTGAYDALESLQLLDGIVDIYGASSSATWSSRRTPTSTSWTSTTRRGACPRERFFEINRRITRAEYDEAVRAARARDLNECHHDDV